MKRLNSIFLALLFTFSSGVALAESNKIGVVDLQKIMQNASEMKDIQAKLEKEFKPRRDKLVAAEESLKKEMEQFKRDSSVLSQSKRKALEKKIVASQQEFEQKGQQYQQELSAAHNKAMEAFYNKVRDAIVHVAKNDKYDMVLQKDAAPYSADKLDVTDKVIKQLK